MAQPKKKTGKRTPEAHRHDVGEWKVLCRMQDPVAVGALVSLLDAEKIPSATPGLAHRGMLGVLGAYVEIVVSVPERDLERARTLLAALETPPDGAEEAPAAPAAAGPRADTPRLRRVAAFVSLSLTLGSGHFYARDVVGGALILAAELVALGCAVLGAPLVALALPVLVLCDLVGAQLVISRVRAGGRPVALGRALPLLAVLTVALAPVVRAASPETLAAPAGVLACEVIAQCGGEARMICIEHLADRRMAGDLSADALETCATCLEPTHTCTGVRACSAACADAVPVPPRALPPGVRTNDDDFVRMLGDLPGVDADLLDRLREREGGESAPHGE